MFVLWEEENPSMSSTQVLVLSQQLESWDFWGPRLNSMSTQAGLTAVRKEVQEILRQQQLSQCAPAVGRLHDPEFIVQPEKRLAVGRVLMEDILLSPDSKRAIINVKALAQLAAKVN
eukprot:gene7342-7554_t